MTYAESLDARLLLAETAIGRDLRAADRKDLSVDEQTKDILRSRGMVG